MARPRKALYAKDISAKMRRMRKPVPVGRCAVSGKNQYETAKEAKQAVKWMVRGANGQSKIRVGLLEPYWCRHCDGWHIGHQRKTA